jgi:hypothetical protein
MMSQRVKLDGEVKGCNKKLRSRSESECDKREQSSDLDTKPSDLSMARLKQE